MLLCSHPLPQAYFLDPQKWVIISGRFSEWKDLLRLQRKKQKQFSSAHIPSILVYPAQLCVCVWGGAHPQSWLWLLAISQNQLLLVADSCAIMLKDLMRGKCLQCPGPSLDKERYLASQEIINFLATHQRMFSITCPQSLTVCSKKTAICVYTWREPFVERWCNLVTRLLTPDVWNPCSKSHSTMKRTV